MSSEDYFLTLEELTSNSTYNMNNSMAASISGNLVGLRKESVKQCLSEFQNVEHRLEFVANIHSVEFINDSKAININSAWYALENANKPVIWIAGGIDKGNDYSRILDLVKAKVKAIVCLGLNNDRIIKYFSDVISDIYETSSMEEAVATANSIAKKGDQVLLAPACASFDLFENYKDRGRKFKEVVNNL